MKVLGIASVFIFLSVCGVAQDDTIRVHTWDTTIFPVKRSSSIISPNGGLVNKNNPQLLNGYFILYNKNHQKTKDGIFKDNRLMDGKNYIYDENGVLMRIQLFKDGAYITDVKE